MTGVSSVEARKDQEKLLIHVPHASTSIPAEYLSDFDLSAAELEAEAMTSADLYTDLLAQAVWPEATIVEAEVSRIVVDVERYPDEAMEEMAKVGRGMIYTHKHDKRDLGRRSTADGRATLKKRHFDPHWSKLRRATQGRILVDLHTYPMEPWSIEPDPAGDRPEIDLGTTDGLTPEPWVTDLIRHFENMGFQVGRNTPYAGVIDAGAEAAVMIEIRRDVLGKPCDVTKWNRMVRALAEMPLPRLHSTPDERRESVE